MTLIRPLRVWIEDRADRAADDEARAEIVNAVDLDQQALADLLLDAEIELLHHGVAQAIVDDVDAGAACAGEEESAERAGQHLRCAGLERAVLIQIDGNAIGIGDHVARGDVQRERASIEALLQRHDFKRDAVVVDAVSAVNAEVGIDRVVEADARRPVVVSRDGACPGRTTRRADCAWHTSSGC